MKFDRIVAIILESFTPKSLYSVTVKTYDFPTRINGVKKNIWTMTVHAVSQADAVNIVFHKYFEESGLANDRRGLQRSKFANALKNGNIKVKKIT